MVQPVRLRLVGFILREKLPANRLANVVASVSEFLVLDVSIARACQVSHPGSVELLDLMWTRSFHKAATDKWSALRLLHTEPRFYSWGFSRALAVAVGRGDSSMIQWLLTHFQGCPVSGEVIEKAARRGYFHILRLLEADESHGGIQWTEESYNEAARAGQWEIVRWLFPRVSSEQRAPILVREAFKQNNLDALTWAIGHEFPVMTFNFDRCSQEEWPRRREIFSVMISGAIQPARIILASAIAQAVQAGDIDFLALLLANSECPDGVAEAMISAAQSGRLETVKYLYETYAQDRNVVVFAEREEIDIPENVDEDYEQCCEEDLFVPSTAIDAAARNGHLEVLQYLHNLDEAAEYPRCSTVAMDAAAARGHLEVLQWLHAHRSEGCTTLAIDSAASRRFHVPNCGGTIRDTCCLDKVPSGFYEHQLAIVQWLHQNRSEGCTSAAMDGAAANGDFTMLQWLHNNTTAGCSHKAMDAAAGLGRLDIVQWLHSNRSEGCSTAAMDNAAANGHLEVVKWLSANRSEGCTPDAMEQAANWGHRAVVEWLYCIRIAKRYQQLRLWMLLQLWILLLLMETCKWYRGCCQTARTCA